MFCGKRGCCMTQHDGTMSIRHMLDHAVEAVEMARGRSRADLDRVRQLNLAFASACEAHHQRGGYGAPREEAPSGIVRARVVISLQSSPPVADFLSS